MDKRAFWNEKILAWENARYSDGFRKSKTLTYRMNYARVALNSFGIGKSVLELGCGSGLLFSSLNAKKFKSLHGIDFSSAAISEARTRDLSQNVSFEEADLATCCLPDVEIVIALGLLDWLDDETLKRVIRFASERKFLISFSKKRISVRQLAHKLFVFGAYGWKSSGYVPRYHSEEKLLDYLPNTCSRRDLVYKQPRPWDWLLCHQLVT